MITLGIVLIILGAIATPVLHLASLSILLPIGVLLLILGILFYALASRGHPVGGRRWY